MDATADINHTQCQACAQQRPAVPSTCANEESQSPIGLTRAPIAETKLGAASPESHRCEPTEFDPTVSQQQAELSAILEAVSDAILVVDAAGVPLMTNPAYDDLLARVGGTLSFVDGDNLPVSPGATPQQRAARGERTTLEFTLLDSDGRQHPYQITILPIWPPGVRGSVGVVSLRDLSDRRVRLLQDHFLAIVGHELRAPASGLLASAEVLVTYLHDEIGSAEAQAAAGRVYRLAERLGGMIHELLDLARASTGKLRVERESVDLTSVVGSAVEIAQILSSGPTIHVEAPSDRVTVRGDSGRLGEVVLNLLTNALKHAPDSDLVDVRIKLGQHEATVEVQDYGCGIPPEELPLIFTKYYRVQRANDDDAVDCEGLGLGLFLAEQIVKAHDGYIDVLSAPGAGTRFTVHLPRP